MSETLKHIIPILHFIDRIIKPQRQKNCPKFLCTGFKLKFLSVPSLPT